MMYYALSYFALVVALLLWNYGAHKGYNKEQ